MRNESARANAVSESNISFREFDLFSFAVWTNENWKKKQRPTTKLKKHSRTSPDVQFKEFPLTKQKTRPRTNINGMEKPFRKKSDPKNRKYSKNQSEIAACEQKTTTEKPNFCSNTVFSLYFKIRAKKIHAAKPLAFSLHFLFRRDQNHYSNLTSKIMKMCEQILKKKTSPQYSSNSLNCKNKS